MTNLEKINNINKKERVLLKNKNNNLNDNKVKNIKNNIDNKNIDNKEVIKSDNNQDVEGVEGVEGVVVKKKRVRKKKIKTPEEIEREKNKPRQRRGRKPKSLFNKLTEENTKKILNNDDEEETIILNLKINKDNNNFNNNKDEERDNKLNLCNFSNLNNNSPLGMENTNEYYYLNQKMGNVNNMDNIGNMDNMDNMYNNILEDFDNDLINSEIKLNKNYDRVKNNVTNNVTNYNCGWCCHSFNNQPFGIPFKYKNEKFYTNGNFCSLECATAYNFNEKKNIQDIWECYNLINFLSHKLGLSNKVKMAPYRECLKSFGGNLTIDEFRNQNKNTDKIFNQLEYPLISVQSHIEEINFNENINNDFIPIDKDRLNRLEQKIKLSKKKFNYMNKNSLEQTMNIKIKTT